MSTVYRPLEKLGKIILRNTNNPGLIRMWSFQRILGRSATALQILERFFHELPFPLHLHPLVMAQVSREVLFIKYCAESTVSLLGDCENQRPRMLEPSNDQRSSSLNVTPYHASFHSLRNEYFELGRCHEILGLPVVIYHPCYRCALPCELFCFLLINGAVSTGTVDNVLKQFVREKLILL